ncbi:MAG: aldo/keto reductase, partial [bacterium]|nr:aldo/keto reductase [bacterium]
YEFNLLNRGILEDHRSLTQDVLLIAYSPLNQGRLAASSKQAAIIREIALERGATPAQITLAAVLADGQCVAVVKASSTGHVDDAVGALDLTLSTDELDRIRSESPAGPVFIAPDEIDLVGTPQMPPYRSIEEAQANCHLLVPSPAALSERLRNGALPMPLRVHRKPDGRYIVDPYDPMDQVKKFWAWVMARPSEPIPVYVLES